MVAGLEGVGLPPVCALLPLFCWVEEPGMEVETTEEGLCDVPVEDTQASTARECESQGFTDRCVRLEADGIIVSAVGRVNSSEVDVLVALE